jgi:hypothetical protein
MMQIGSDDLERLEAFRGAVAGDTQANVELGEDPDDLTLPARVVNDLGEDIDFEVEQIEHERHLDQVNEDIDRWVEKQFGSFEVAVDWLGDQPDANAAVEELIEVYCDEHGLDSATGYPLGENAAGDYESPGDEPAEPKTGTGPGHAGDLDHDALEQLTAGMPDV